MADLSDLELRETAHGVALALRVRPAARADAILGVHGRALRVAVRAAPEKGRANDAVLELLAGAADVPRAAVRLASGGASRDKRVVVSGVAPEVLRARLASAVVRGSD